MAKKRTRKRERERERKRSAAGVIEVYGKLAASSSYSMRSTGDRREEWRQFIELQINEPMHTFISRVVVTC